MSKEAKSYLESKFVAAKGKPDYLQLSKDLLDDYGFKRSVKQLKRLKLRLKKRWLQNNRRRLNESII
jgi:hypothetical protein